jgi:hypothetical protein
MPCRTNRRTRGRQEFPDTAVGDLLSDLASNGLDPSDFREETDMIEILKGRRACRECLEAAHELWQSMPRWGRR